MILKVNCNAEGIKKTSQIIENGGIVIFPTDTVYEQDVIHIMKIQ